jgi:hypothetical protein
VTLIDSRWTAAPALTSIVSVTSPAPRQTWEEMAAADTLGLVTQSPAWLDSLLAMGGYEDASWSYELANGHQLVLPLVRRRGLPRGLSSFASLPNSWGMGGLLARGDLCTEDIAAVFSYLVKQPFARLSLRPNPLLASIWEQARPPQALAVPRLAHVLDLQGGFDQVWSKRFDSDTRNKIRKAERSGLVVECDTSGKLVPQFYALFELSIVRWAEQQHEPLSLARWRARRRDPLRKFESIAHNLGDAAKIWMAWYGSQPVAAILVLQGANAHYTRGVMDKVLAGPLRANYLLHRLAIEDACRAGCRCYHMGESGSSDNLAFFKERFGAEPVAYAEYILERVPLTSLDSSLRRLVKSMIGFRDA